MHFILIRTSYLDFQLNWKRTVIFNKSSKVSLLSDSKEKYLVRLTDIIQF